MLLLNGVRYAAVSVLKPVIMCWPDSIVVDQHLEVWEHPRVHTGFDIVI